MNERSVQDHSGELLTDAARSIEVAPMDLSTLIHAGRARRRRSRQIVGLSVAAGAVAVVGLTLTIPSVLDPDNVDGSSVAAGDGSSLSGLSAPDEPDTTTTPVALPTSDQPLGSIGDGASIEGTVAIDGKGCVFLSTAAGDRYVVWPLGFMAEKDASGVKILDPSGEVVARVGDAVSAGGQFNVQDGEGACLPTGEVAVMQSSLTVVRNP